jgi:Mrp family chromosome partitioning ATPase
LTLTKYGPDHRRVADVRAELQNVRDLMAAEIGRIIRSLEIDIARSMSVEEGLSEILARLKEQVAAANLARVELEALRRDAEANRRILDVLTSRLAETRSQADRGLLQPDASIIALARVPLGASYPQPKLLLALALVLATGAGLGCILAAEWLRRGFCSGDEIERATGLPVLGLLPPLRGRRWRPKLAAVRLGKVSLQPLAGRQGRAIYRSMRWLGNSIALHNDKPRIVLLTSAKTGEGKTTAATALAGVLSQGHGNILVVEADLCRCGTSSASPGLRDLLIGAVSVDAAIVRDDASGVYMLPAGTVGQQPQEALPWPAIENLLAGLRQRFDWVVIDGPSILQAPEARLLSRLADATIFVVKWAATDRRLVAAGLDQIEQSGGRAVGILLTMVRARRYARYSHRDSYRFLFDSGKQCTS